MKLHRLETILPVLLLSAALLAPGAIAQVSPGDMVSGTLQQTNNPGTHNVTLYNVPAGKHFVLTDFNFSYTLLLSTNTTTTTLTLRENGVDRWVWRTLQSVSPVWLLWPVEKSFATGLAFGPGTQVNLNLVMGGNNSTSWSVSWAGYLAPAAAAAIPELEPGPSQALRVDPSPARSGTTIRFDLAEPAPVVLAVYDVQGRRVRTLLEGPLGAGSHAAAWDGTDDRGEPVGDGVYFAQLQTAGLNETRKIPFVR